VLSKIGSMVVYHVTPSENVQSILDTEIDPSYHKGKMVACWFISKQRIEWAIIHCSVGHSVPIDELAVCAVLVDSKDLYKFNRPGFYYSFKGHKIESATPAMFFLHSMGMGEIENE